MLNWTEEMICSKCGKKFRHEFTDVVKPWDVEFRKHPLCKKCQATDNLRNCCEAGDKLITQSPFVTGPVIINPFKIIDKINKIRKK